MRIISVEYSTADVKDRNRSGFNISMDLRREIDGLMQSPSLKERRYTRVHKLLRAGFKSERAIKENVM